MQKVIKNFFTGNHLKETFDSNSRIIKLLTILYGEIKRTVKAIGCNKKVFATAFRNPQKRLLQPTNSSSQ